MQHVEPFLGPSRQRPFNDDDLQLEPELELDVLPDEPPELEPPELEPPELEPPELEPPELEPPLSDEPQATDAAATTKTMNETERRSMGNPSGGWGDEARSVCCSHAETQAPRRCRAEIGRASFECS